MPRVAATFPGIEDYVQEFVPESIRNKASEYWDYVPQPIKSAARFGFDFIKPDPYELPQPLGTALNVPKRLLTPLAEELMDTLPKHLGNRKILNTASNTLNKYRGILGYLGGEGNVVDTSNRIAKKLLDPPDTGYYNFMFNRPGQADEFANLIEGANTPEKLKQLFSSFRHGNPAIGINDRNLDVMRSQLSSLGSKTIPEIEATVKHELTHLGQDIAPKGIWKEFLEQGKKRTLLDYQTDPAEILIEASRRNNPNIVPGMSYVDRLGEAMRAQGTARVRGNKGKYFLSDILPLLQRYGE